MLDESGVGAMKALVRTLGSQSDGNQQGSDLTALYLKGIVPGAGRAD